MTFIDQLREATVGDGLCIHGGGARCVAPTPEAPPDALPVLALMLESHPIRTIKPAPDGSHEADDLTSTLYLLDVTDVALLVSWLLAASTAGGLREALEVEMLHASRHVRTAMHHVNTATGQDNWAPTEGTPVVREVGGYL